MSPDHSPADDTLVIAGRRFSARLIVGTGGALGLDGPRPARHTAGRRTAAEALLTARLAREAPLDGMIATSW